MIYDKFLETLRRKRDQGFRFCHNKSARKHRRRGDTVHYIGEGLYAWRIQDDR